MFDYIDYKIFFKKKNKHFLKKVVENPKKENEISIKDIINNHEDIFLKIDIEGYEYEILSEITRHSKKLISLIVEFHDINLNLDKIKKFIVDNQYLKLIHIHANNFKEVNIDGNPNDIELTFVNIDKIDIFKKISKKLSYRWIGL